MTTTASLSPPPPPPPPLTVEPPTPSAVSPPPLEQPNLTTTVTDPPSITSHSHSPKLETLTPLLPPLFINSIAELKDLSAAIASFHECYDDLLNHLDSIKSAILSKLPPETLNITTLPPPSPQKVDISYVALPKHDDDVTDDVTDGELIHKQPEEVEERKDSNSELDGLCRAMCSREIRKYIAAHMSDLPKLRDEVPRALRTAPDRPRLVLECLGKFYLQGSKAFTRNSPMVAARDASIMILECYLLMMGGDSAGDGIEKEVKEEADKAAVAWRKRLVVEGGLGKANRVDARGLLMFVACFGVPDSFRREDVPDLVAAGNAKEIAGVLRNSNLLMSKIPEIVEGLVKHKRELDAVNLVWTFGLEERFNPQTILISYLRESKESWKKSKKGSNGSSATLNEANKKQLASLKSIRRCLERHKIDPAKLLPGWQINEKITTLEKDIADSDRKEKTAQKRKASESESSRKPRTLDPKRSRYTNQGLQHPNTVGHVGIRRNFLDSGMTNHVHNYPSSAPAAYGGPGAGSMIPSRGGPGMSYPGPHHGGVIVDPAGQVNRGANPYVWHRDSGLNERYANVGQSSGVGLTSLYRASANVEGFPGVGPGGSSVGVGSRGSDLYQFADSVVESESYPSGGARSLAGVHTPTGTTVPAHYSYLYQG